MTGDAALDSDVVRAGDVVGAADHAIGEGRQSGNRIGANHIRHNHATSDHGEGGRVSGVVRRDRQVQRTGLDRRRRPVRAAIQVPDELGYHCARRDTRFEVSRLAEADIQNAAGELSGIGQAEIDHLLRRQRPRDDRQIAGCHCRRRTHRASHGLDSLGQERHCVRRVVNAVATVLKDKLIVECGHELVFGGGIGIRREIAHIHHVRSDRRQHHGQLVHQRGNLGLKAVGHAVLIVVVGAAVERVKLPVAFRTGQGHVGTVSRHREGMTTGLVQNIRE